MSKEALESKLRQAGIAIEESEGFFRGTFSGDGRSQLWLIDYDAHDCGGDQAYHLLSPIGAADNLAYLRTACEMAALERGGIVVLWEQIFFKMKVGIDLDADTTRFQIEYACKTADGMEAATFGGDQF